MDDGRVIGHCDTCGYLLDVAHNAICADLIGARYQLKQQQIETNRLARELRVAKETCRRYLDAYGLLADKESG